MTYRLRNILIAFALAIVAALLVTLYVTNYKKHVQREQTTVPVLVAVKDIPVGTAGADIVAHNYLKVEALARTSVVPGTLSNPSEIGSQVVTEPVYAGEQVTARRFGHIAPTGIRSQLKGVYRALQVPGDGNSLLAGTLQAGDRVDVVASISYKVKDVDVKRLAAAVTGAAGNTSGSDSGSSDEEKVATRTVLRNINVLQTSGTVVNGKLVRGSGGGNWVMLAVTDDQAQKLYWVMKNATWSLTLRPVIDAADSANSVETLQSVLGDGMQLSQYVQLWIGRTPAR
jgi:Flp pilus assembly protein CpaB